MTPLLAQWMPALGWALVEFLWQGLVIGLAAAIGLQLLRNARPQARYALSCVALATCLLLPALNLLGHWPSVQGTGVAQSPLAIANARPSLLAADVSIDSWRAGLQSQLPWVVIAWSLGAGALALRLALGCVWVSRVRSCAGTIDAHWQARLDRLAHAMAIASPVELRLANTLNGPIAAGWWRPTVLVPMALVARMPVDLLEALLAHELAHIKRYDYLVNLMQGAVEALLFYHPVVWWLSRRVRIEREQIADDLAALAIGDSRRLALALQQLDQFQASRAAHPTPHLATAAHGGMLMNRIKRLLRPDRQALEWRTVLPALGLSALCLAVFAQAAPQAIAGPAATTKAQAAASSQVHQPYALVHGGKDEMMVSGDMRDRVDVKQARQQLDGDFLWFRRGSSAYVVQDPKLLGQAIAAWQPAEAVGAKMEVLGDQMRPHSEKMDALGQQMDSLAKLDEPTGREMEKLGKQMEPLGAQQQAIGEKMQRLGDLMASSDQARREQLQQDMAALQQQMQPLQQQMEQLSTQMQLQADHMRAAQEPMQALARQMEQASKPMQALGDQMQVLGKQQEKLSHEADAQLQLLIDQSLRDGKAVPVQSAR